MMADIPGLIEGASGGAGLGTPVFCAMWKRCRLLVHIVDVSGSEGRDPREDFRIINEELAKFDADLAARPMLVAGNKCDLTDEETVESFRRFVEEQGYEFFPLMAAISYGVEPLLNRISELLSKLPPILRYERSRSLCSSRKMARVTRFMSRKQTVCISWRETGCLSLFSPSNFDDYESLQYFQRVLISSGVIDALRAAGVQEGDTVRMYDLEFDFME